jgi:hypothetical protein
MAKSSLSENGETQMKNLVKLVATASIGMIVVIATAPVFAGDTGNNSGTARSSTSSVSSSRSVATGSRSSTPYTGSYSQYDPYGPSHYAPGDQITR